jgi:hypothetical protein
MADEDTKMTRASKQRPRGVAADAQCLGEWPSLLSADLTVIVRLQRKSVGFVDSRCMEREEGRATLKPKPAQSRLALVVCVLPHPHYIVFTQQSSAQHPRPYRRQFESAAPGLAARPPAAGK